MFGVVRPGRRAAADGLTLSGPLVRPRSPPLRPPLSGAPAPRCNGPRRGRLP
ncbi:hypothetical protein KCH_58820 [Kitasatospora cheerisanensis KCTC 2395]|uniref:Uncharacterized protein n=1 Tax=Kitasatospora cheerisanensis KCTC 2395 TaxID=1348663 RepID=A0A066YWR9_9ACTN|nr:hypothetical protein KCH_58820 [Kitasatospora cheerisanensis KCTC 2395]